MKYEPIDGGIKQLKENLSKMSFKEKLDHLWTYYKGVLAILAVVIAICSIIVAIVRKFVLLLPLIYLVPRLVADKTMGVYLAEPIADVLAVTFTAVLFSIQFRKSLAAVEEKGKTP